jgi:hypothetical protein
MTTAKIFINIELDNGKNIRYQFLPTLYKNYAGEVFVVNFTSPCYRSYKPSWTVQYKKQFGDCGIGIVNIIDFVKMLIFEGRAVSLVKSVEKINPDNTVMRI